MAFQYNTPNSPATSCNSIHLPALVGIRQLKNYAKSEAKAFDLCRKVEIPSRWVDGHFLDKSADKT
jgi:hypothetical protein